MNVIIVANWATLTKIASFRIRDLTEVSIYVERERGTIIKVVHSQATHNQIELTKL